MPSGLRLGRVLGIPIAIHWSILAVVGLITANLAVQYLPLFVPGAGLRLRLVAAGIGVTLFFASILAHELGHSLVALGHGVGVSGITLWLLGGMAELDRAVPSARAELRIAAAGPAVSALLALFFACITFIALQLEGPLLAVAVGVWLALVNLSLAVFNLLPAAPLDGGRILAAVVWKRLDEPETARVVAGRCGLVLGVALFVYGLVQLGIQDLLQGWITAAIGLFVFQAARGEIRGAVIRRRLRATPVALLLARRPPSVPDTASVQELDRWAGPGGRYTAFPVVRWGREPVGYVVPAPLARLNPVSQSWTRLGQVMHPAGDVDRVSLHDSAETVLDRWGDDTGRIAVVHEPDRLEPVGTLTYPQVRPLLARPDLWGRDRRPPAPSAVASNGQEPRW